MADIGSTLRETRIRKKIDITSVEEATKIRAKYLRALENEEWRLLPGPTYVKTFLRTYAEYLGLDPRLLVEEYSARFERPEDLELPAFSREARVRSRVTRVPPPSRWGARARRHRRDPGVPADPRASRAATTTATTASPPRPPSATGSAAPRRAAPATAESQKPSRPAPQVGARTRGGHAAVWVCLVDAKGNDRIAGQTVAPGERQGPFRSSAFKVTFGNGGGDLVIDGKRRDTPERSEPTGYSIKPSGTEILPASERPTCG